MKKSNTWRVRVPQLENEMHTRKLLKKQIDLRRLIKDVASGEIHGLHYHEKGTFDQTHEIIEITVARSRTHTYAVKLYLLENHIQRVERVKFQWECGGWRSEDTIIKRFPFHFYKCEEPVDEILGIYLKPAIQPLRRSSFSNR